MSTIPLIAVSKKKTSKVEGAILQALTIYKIVASAVVVLCFRGS